MKISYNWIRDYLETDIAPEKLGEILTNLGLEVEGLEEWESVTGGLQGIVIGRVLTCSKHPDADRLSVTTVDTGGDRPLQIVCGAPNVAAGQIVPVATVGSMVWKGGESFEIKRSKIRGIESEGMICAEDELGMGDSHEGIMVLGNDAVPGMAGGDYFKITRDHIFEIGLTPNRIDSGSHYGVARDVAAYLSLRKTTTAKKPDTSQFSENSTPCKCSVTVENSADCIRYSGLTISGVKVAESPDWLKNRLRAVGQTPINNVVDITNFVLLEIGQPLHAFDAAKISGNEIIVKNLPDKTAFITLDKEKRELSSSDLMICDKKEGLCIAGVFGGAGSGVTDGTTDIFLESAWFNPVSVRKTARRHNLNTNASFRFERGADPEITTWALKRAALMIRDLAGGEISAITDIYPKPVKRRIIDVTYHNINRLIGIEIDKGVIKGILKSLEIEIKEENTNGLKLEIPAYRVDVFKEADVVEEILRIYGFNSIPVSAGINSTITYIKKPDREKLMQSISDMLSSNGFAEIMNNSLTPLSWYENSSEFSAGSLVKLSNPLSNDLNTMRRTLLFGGLSTIAWNINRQNYNLRLFEFGNVYSLKGVKGDFPVVNDFCEEQVLALFITGSRMEERWNEKSQPADFFLLRSFAEMVVSKMGIDPQTLNVAEVSKSYFSGGLLFSLNGKSLVEGGRISPQYLKRFEIDQEVFYAEINWENLIAAHTRTTTIYSELPKFPSVRRDLALLVDRDVRFEDLRAIAFKTEKNILKEVTLFDVYESDSLGKNKKSYALSFILQDNRKTLTDKNIEKTMGEMATAFHKELGAVIR